jgi:ssRNA-specific RNase YbeY (16S rRNA maturation enzyme)
MRVMVHGLLHLIGFNDKTPKEKTVIRAAEEDSIKLYLSIKRKNKKTVK